MSSFCRDRKMVLFILPSFHHVCFGTIRLFVKLSFSQTLEWHIQIVTAMLCISSTEELRGNIKTHFWLTVKTMQNLEEILLTSDPTQHSSSFELASLWTQEPAGSSNVGQDTLSRFLCIPPHTHPHPCSLPPSGDFTPMCSAIRLRRRVVCWMLKDIRQERFLPEKEPLYKILQHMILWWVNLHQPSAPTSCTPHCPQWDGEEKIKWKG